jgi:hypothetical protein
LLSNDKGGVKCEKTKTRIPARECFIFIYVFTWTLGQRRVKKPGQYDMNS